MENDIDQYHPPTADAAVHQEGDQSNKESEIGQQEELPSASDDIPTEISLPPHENEFGERSYVNDSRTLSPLRGKLCRKVIIINLNVA